MDPQNIDNLTTQHIWRDNAGLITKYLGLAAGSKKIYVNIDIVPSKAFSTKYHSHSQQEEFFMILDGCGILKINNEEYQVKKGDFVAKPSGENISHTFYNSSEEILVILDVGTIEKEDTCFYPDYVVYLHKSNGVSRVYKDGNIENWSSDPNSRSIV